MAEPFSQPSEARCELPADSYPPGKPQVVDTYVITMMRAFLDAHGGDVTAATTDWHEARDQADEWESFIPAAPCLSCGAIDGHASWCGPDYLTRECVEVPTTSSSIPAHVLDKPAVGAYRDPDLVAAKRWQTPRVDVPPTTDEEREWVANRIVALAAERQARSDAHRGRIRRTAAWLGREVSAHKVTLADADTRIDRLLGAFDPESAVPILLVPFREATQIAADAFEVTFKGHAHG